ncbi:MAG: hypothetical protein LC792_21850, partial [Actinobacteria bacterium]|nr:hypothetical protein [Actinomycetota bacterium]
MPTDGGPELAALASARIGQEPLPAVFAEHGGGASRGLDRLDPSTADSGRFGRMFPDLPPFLPKPATLEALAASMFPGPPVAPSPPVGAAAALEPGENPNIAAGYTYLGQFVDHDVTYDPLSSLQRQNDPEGLRSFRTPRFDLDPLYGSGPIPSAFLYDQTDPVKLLIGRNRGRGEEKQDLPRNHQG